MAAPNQPTGPIQQKLYVLKAALNAAPANYAAVTGGVAADANEVKRATAFGPIDLRGNQASWSPYGSGAERSIAAQATPQEIPFTFVVQEALAKHAEILALSVGDVVQAAVNIVVGQTAVAYWVQGSVASRSIGFGNPRECTMGLTILLGPTRLAK